MKGRFQGPDTRQSLARRAVQGGLWEFASTYFTIGFGFLANIYLVRTLPVSAYGIIALAGALMGFVQVGSYLGLGTAFVQTGDRSHRALCSYAGLKLGLSLISIFLLIGISPFLRKICSDLTVDVALILAGLSTIRVVASIGGLLMERELRFRQSSMA